MISMSSRYVFVIVELIDTLWNVNYFDFLSGLNVSGINRYIMECKSSSYLNLTLSVT